MSIPKEFERPLGLVYIPVPPDRMLRLISVTAYNYLRTCTILPSFMRYLPECIHSSGVALKLIWLDCGLTPTILTFGPTGFEETAGFAAGCCFCCPLRKFPYLDSTRA